MPSTEIIPPAVRQAVLAAAREFNSGRYFEAHEMLEESLEEVPDDLWDLFLGLIQIAVGYHKVQQGYVGGTKMLGLGLEKVELYAADAGGLDLEALRARVRADLAEIETSGTPITTSPPRLVPLR